MKPAIEHLEPRHLVTFGEFEIVLYADDCGIPGDPIADDAVNVGETFFVEILAREHDLGVAGFQGVSLNIYWDPDVLEEIDVFDSPRELVTENLPGFPTGTIVHETGTFWNLGGSASLSGRGKPIGSDGDDRFVKPHLRGLSITDDHFAWLHFRAIQPADESLITMRQGGSRIATLPVFSLGNSDFDFERQQITVVGDDDPDLLFCLAVAADDLAACLLATQMGQG